MSWRPVGDNGTGSKIAINDTNSLAAKVDVEKLEYINENLVTSRVKRVVA